MAKPTNKKVELVIVVDENAEELQKYYNSIMKITNQILFFNNIESAKECILNATKKVGLVITELSFSDKNSTAKEPFPEQNGMDFYDDLITLKPKIPIIVITKKIEDELDFHETFFANVVINADTHLEKDDLTVVEFERRLFDVIH